VEEADGRSASASSAAGERVFEVNIAATEIPQMKWLGTIRKERMTKQYERLRKRSCDATRLRMIILTVMALSVRIVQT